MSHISKRESMPDLRDLTIAMARAAEGQPMANVAQAALDLCLGIWALSGDVTREMAIAVVTSQIESRFRERSN
jgi:hypothetical protein